VDLSKALGEIIENITEHRGHIFHLSNDTPENGITWCQFTREIFQISKKDTRVIPCTTDEYKTKAVRPKYSKMRNSSLVQLRDWKDGLEEYIRQI
jgi:dTDP-4-dehydrorhamnose reductase